MRNAKALFNGIRTDRTGLRQGLCLFLATLLLTSCGNADQPEDENEGDKTVTEREEPTGTKNVPDPSALLTKYDLANPSGTFELTESLKEISGLAMSPDGRLFGHHDEQGIVYELDPTSGKIVKRWGVGSWGLEEDFEGIAVVEETFYLISSKGDIFAFSEGEDQGNVEFEQYKTDLTGKFDVEGLCYNPSENELLIVCKEYPGKDYTDGEEKTVYAFSLQSKEIVREPRIVMDVKEVLGMTGDNDFKPSAIERHPKSGSYFILSSNDPAIIEVSSSGKLLAAYELDKSIHPQPEGIAFGANGELYIGNELGGLVVYQPGS